MITLLTPWLGEPPPWLDKFEERMEANAPYVRWLFLQPSVGELRDRIAAATGVVPPLQIGGRKSCDFRPAWGVVWSDVIGDSGWFGWADADCVFGDLAGWLTPELLSRYDLVSDHPTLANGTLTVIRTSHAQIFRTWPGGSDERYGGVGLSYVEAFSTPQHVAWDEARLEHITGLRVLGLEGVHAHDGNEPAPALSADSGRLYSGKDGRELLTFHFATHRPKRWPL